MVSLAKFGCFCLVAPIIGLGLWPNPLKPRVRPLMLLSGLIIGPAWREEEAEGKAREGAAVSSIPWEEECLFPMKALETEAVGDRILFE